MNHSGDHGAMPQVLDGLGRVTEWTPGLPVSTQLTRKTTVGRWFDIERDADADAVAHQLQPYGHGQITADLIADLLAPDERPEPKSYAGAGLRSLTSFKVSLRRPQPESTAKQPPTGVPAQLVFEPVKIIASANWLLSCWHDPQTFIGAQRARSDNNGPDRLTREHVAAVVSRRWVETKATNIADLGALILHELAESYRPTVYELYSWLDDWELSLYSDESVDRVTLQAIWGSAATLRAWVKPLNLPGMRMDPDKAWFHGSFNHEIVLAVDDRVDGALGTLRKLSDTLRASFAVAQFQLAEDEHREREQFQARVALLTATLAGPILVTALFGARARPFGDTWTSFAGITVITVASIGAIWGLFSLRNRRSRGAG